MTAGGDLIVSGSGVRGGGGESLTPAAALAFASALGADTGGRARAPGRRGRARGGRVLELVDAAAIRAAGLTAFHDANNGAGGPLGRSLLQALHVETAYYGCDAAGLFLHEPEPTAANLRDVAPLVRRHGAAVG